MITETATSIYKKECQEKKYVITISMHGGKYKRDICFIPLINNIMLTYKLLELKVNRQCSQDFIETIEFLINEIEDDISNNLNDDIEYGGYWPDNDEFYNEHYIVVKRENENIFCKQFKQEHMQKVTCSYLKNLRFATII